MKQDGTSTGHWGDRRSRKNTAVHTRKKSPFIEQETESNPSSDAFELPVKNPGDSKKGARKEVP